MKAMIDNTKLLRTVDKVIISSGPFYRDSPSLQGSVLCVPTEVSIIRPTSVFVWAGTKCKVWGAGKSAGQKCGDFRQCRAKVQGDV